MLTQVTWPKEWRQTCPLTFCSAACSGGSTGSRGGGDEALRLLISGTPGQRNRCLRRLHGMDTEQADEQDSRGLSPFRAGAPDPRRLSGDVDQERAGQDQRPVLHPAEPIVLTVAKCEASRDYLGYVNSCPGPHAWYLNCTGEDC